VHCLYNKILLLHTMKWLRETYWHQLFEAGIFVKGLNSIWETTTGIFLLTALRNWFTHTIIFVSTSEFLGRSDDFPFTYAHQHIMHITPYTRVFIGAYLLFHGIMNAFLAYNLYRNRLWSYPVSMAFTTVFFLYQVYRLAHTHSPLLLVISVLDILFIILTWHEYQRQLKKQKATPENN
jgi:uncharacterized membrane protein